MKSVKAATIALILLIISVFANSVLVAKTVNEFAEKLEKIDFSEAHSYEDLKILKSDFESARRWITLTVSHDDISYIEEAFADIVGAIDADEESDIIISKSRLINALRHLGRLSGINIDSIL